MEIVAFLFGFLIVSLGKFFAHGLNQTSERILALPNGDSNSKSRLFTRERV